MVGIPQPEDVIKASARDIVKSLDKVNPEVVEMFGDCADILIDKFEGDTKKALCITLAFLSGHYKEALGTRSLLTG